jgi:hypothetical protein
MRTFLATVFALLWLASPVFSQNVKRPTYENVRYGPHERNVLDFWQAKASTPTRATWPCWSR